MVKDRSEFHDLLIESFLLEWEQKLPLIKDNKLITIYFGGGTPSLLPPNYIEKILKAIETSGFSLENVEITMEANPEGVSAEYFSAIYSLGVNRLSLGVQSLDDRSLLSIGRGHGAKEAKNAIMAASQAHFKNISIDLMYDLPNQSLESFNYTLDQIQNLPIHHLSLYNLTIEPGTVFDRKKKQLQLPNATTSLRLLELAIEKLTLAGFERYEISAFAKEGKKSNHNLGYWTARPFLGFGPSAFSYWEGKRIRNVCNLIDYANRVKNKETPVDFSEKLPSPKDAQELFAIRLRLLEGADLQKYPTLTNETLNACDQWISTGHLQKEGNIISLTDKGTLFYDEIATEII